MSGFNPDINNDEYIVCPFCKKNIPTLNSDIHIPRCQRYKRPQVQGSEMVSNSNSNANDLDSITNNIVENESYISTVINDFDLHENVIPLLDDSINTASEEPEVIYVDSADTSFAKNESNHSLNGKVNMDQWSCSVCTYLNELSSTVCGVCGSLIPGCDTIPSDIDNNTGSVGVWGSNKHNGSDTATVDVINGGTSANANTNTNASLHYWKCDTCTYSENTRSSHHCSMCGGERPGDNAFVDQLIPSSGSSGTEWPVHRPTTRSMLQSSLPSHTTNNHNNWHHNEAYDSDSEFQRSLWESQELSGTHTHSSYNNSSGGNRNNNINRNRTGIWDDDVGLAGDSSSLLQGMALGGLAGVGLSMLGDTRGGNGSGSGAGSIGKYVQNAAFGAAVGAVGSMIYKESTSNNTGMYSGSNSNSSSGSSRTRGYNPGTNPRAGSINGRGTPDEMERIFRRQRERHAGAGIGMRVGTGPGQEAHVRRRARRDPFDPVGLLMAETMYQMHGGRGRGRGRGRGGFDIDNMSYEQLLERFEPGTSAAPAGRNVIDSLPEQTYHTVINCTKSDDIEILETKCEVETKCAICLSEFEEGDSIKSLPCLHRFHSKCIDQWLKRSGDCPICKFKI